MDNCGISRISRRGKRSCNSVYQAIKTGYVRTKIKHLTHMWAPSYCIGVGSHLKPRVDLKRQHPNNYVTPVTTLVTRDCWICSYAKWFPVRRTAQRAIHVTSWQTRSFHHQHKHQHHQQQHHQHQPDFSGRQPTTLQLLHEYRSFTYIHHSFIQLSELRQRRLNEIV